ncbi:MAG TPA: MASE1 domain-containing protein [Azospirillaceae bacterium]|nr:MASE1 domain-containing protein [Azospirillaceae bacterium]
MAVESMTPAFRAVVVSAAFLAAYLFLDQISFIYAFHKFNITPWNPPVGLALACLLLVGPRFAAVIVLGRLLGDLFLRDMPTPLMTSGLGAGLIAGGYAMAAVILRRWIGIDLRLSRSRDMLWLIAVALVTTMVVACGYVLLLIAFDLLPLDAFLKAVTRRWVGDAIGIMTITPFLLAHGPALLSRPGMPLRLSMEKLAQATSVVLVLWVIFGIDWDESGAAAVEFQFFYLLFLPLIWIAVRTGLTGVAIGVLGTQVGLIIAIRTLGDYSGTTVTALQMLMITLAVTSLLLGSIVSERRRTEGLLRDSEARLQALVRTAPDGIITAAPDGTIATLNPAAEHLFGFAAGELVGQPAARILPQFDGMRALAAAGGEMDARRHDGSAVPVEVTVSETAVDGRHLFIAMIRDVSQRKQIEARLAQKQAELAHVSRLSLMGEMASALAHEINQPLSAIANYTRVCQMLLDSGKAAPERIRETMDKAVHQAERAGEIIRRLREFLGKGETQFAVTPVERIFEEVMDLSRTGAAQAGIALKVTVDGHLPPLFVDNIQTEQVLLNLVRNSMDALVMSEHSRREVVLSAQRDGPDFIRFTVRDTGPGISRDIVDQLFTPFSTTKPTGMGLGLSISRSIVEAHGGRLWAEPDQPAGAVFHFTLPIAPVLDEQHA